MGSWCTPWSLTADVARSMWVLQTRPTRRTPRSRRTTPRHKRRSRRRSCGKATSSPPATSSSAISGEAGRHLYLAHDRITREQVALKAIR
jgi:hypothetical protein